MEGTVKSGKAAGSPRDCAVDTKARRFAQGFFLALSVVLVVLAGGTEFVQRPVGIAFLVLWTVLALATAAFRLPGRPSTYDRRQVLPRVVLGVFGFLALLAVGPWEYTHLSGPIPRDGALAWAGIALFAAGAALYSWAMQALHGQFTIRLSVAERPRLITDGPYAIVRHPGYFGWVLALPGMGLALGSLAILAFAVPMLAWIVTRIRDEEAMLVAEFGDEYRAYQGRTKRLIPFLY